MGTWVVHTPGEYTAFVRAMEQRMKEISEQVPKTTTKAAADVVMDCISRAVQRAPVDTGDLRSQGYAEVNGAVIARGTPSGDVTGGGSPSPQGDAVEASAGFTPLVVNGTDYVMVQHEHVEFNHPKGGEAKFLSSVVVENEDRWIKHMADAGRRALRGDGV